MAGNTAHIRFYAPATAEQWAEVGCKTMFQAGQLTCAVHNVTGVQFETIKNLPYVKFVQLIKPTN